MIIKSASKIFILAVVVIATVSFASAQSKRKPKPLATPLPTLTGAEIISRAGDWSDDEAVTTPDTKPSKTSPKKPKRETTPVASDAAKKSEYDDKQKRMLMNLDILTRAEQRSEGLRRQLFEMIEKENSIKTRIDKIDYDSRGEEVEKLVQIAGSLRPEEVRDNRRKSLAAEKANLQSLLTEVQNNKASITLNLQKADLLVEKLRVKLEKDIDDSFLKDDEPQN